MSGSRFIIAWFSILAILNLIFAFTPPIDGWSVANLVVGVLCAIIAVIENKDETVDGPR